MKHIDYYREKEGSYFRDVTAFVCESDAEYNKMLDKYCKKCNEGYYEVEPTLSEDTNYEFQGKSFKGFTFTEYGRTFRLDTIFLIQ